MEEITAAIKHLKRHKVAAPDSIPANVHEIDTHLISTLLQPILTQIWHSETLPTDWKRGLIVKIQKQRDASICDNWRGITLLNTCSKVLTKIVHSRIARTIEANMRHEQAGFRPLRSCTDHVNTLRMTMEQSIEWKPFGEH